VTWDNVISVTLTPLCLEEGRKAGETKRFSSIRAVLVALILTLPISAGLTERPRAFSSMAA
jgi:hypothetical protein